MAYITVEDIKKTYRITKSGKKNLSFYEMLTGGVGRALRYMQGVGEGVQFEEVKALDGVSFSLDEGDVLGVIGKNGSGKSTLLKILSRITLPTAGRAVLKGRVASLLEVGTGFHPELTGRENIYMNGVILGLSRQGVQQRFDEIVSFSGVEKFLDTPVKRYSSGMVLRLAFSVAAHLDPEILVIDEVLAVGDYEFQRKCLKAMNNLGSAGRTIIFVSHNLGAVSHLCNKGLLLNSGRIIKQGNIQDVISAHVMQDKTLKSEMVWNEQNAPQDDTAMLKSIRAVTEQGECKESFSIQESVHIEVEYEVRELEQHLIVIIQLVDAEGTTLFKSVDTSTSGFMGKVRKPGLYKSICVIPPDFLNDRNLLVTVALIENGNKMRVRAENAISISMYDNMSLDGPRGGFTFNWGRGVVRPLLQWKTEYSGLSSTLLKPLTQDTIRKMF